jgi:hypothetical protein
VRDAGDVFNVAIPAYDLQAAQHFHVDLLGCKLARHYDDRITLDFIGDQVVCHLTARDPGSKGGPESMYARHFGVTFLHGEDFEAVHEVAVMREIPFFSELSSRFEGRAEVHRTFVLRDPSDSLIVIMQFYVVFPLFLLLLRASQRHHQWLLSISLVLQLVLVSLIHWSHLPSWILGLAVSREFTSYQF